MNAKTKARAVKLLVLDVDGVLTDGRLYYGHQGEELKAFYTPDGLGIKLLQKSGIDVAIITGRQSGIVAGRAAELGISQVVQGREDKLQALQELTRGTGLTAAELAYMGDDLPDLAALRYAGLGMTPANAQPLLSEHADWQSQRPGGSGAVREACEFILDAQDKLTSCLHEYL